MRSVFCWITALLFGGAIQHSLAADLVQLGVERQAETHVAAAPGVTLVQQRQGATPPRSVDATQFDISGARLYIGLEELRRVVSSRHPNTRVNIVRRCDSVIRPGTTFPCAVTLETDDIQFIARFSDTIPPQTPTSQQSASESLTYIQLSYRGQITNDDARRFVNSALTKYGSPSIRRIDPDRSFEEFWWCGRFTQIRECDGPYLYVRFDNVYGATAFAQLEDAGHQGRLNNYLSQQRSQRRSPL